MPTEVTRERIIELIRQMREHTVDRGCTPGEAAKFAAKVAEFIERYQINEAEVRGQSGAGADGPEFEMAQNILRTGKKAHNPGMTEVVSGLAGGMSCRVVLDHQYYDGQKEAVYGIVGEVMDCDLVCQLSTTVVPALRVMASMEGIEHGYEKAGLIRWSNQYLGGAGQEIHRRLVAEREERSREKVAASICTALVVTGDTLAVIKRAATEEVFKKFYPNVRYTKTRSEYNHTARERGREAGKRVGLRVGIEGE